MTITAEICICGLDPGLRGAVAWYFPTRPDLIRADDMPVAAGDVDPATLAAWMRQMMPAYAVVEAVHSMPKQGVASSFRFGRAYGTALGVLAACKVPVHLVPPTTWKKYWKLSSDKEQSRALALRLWPGAGGFARRRDEGRAEAALLARYGAEVISGGSRDSQVGKPTPAAASTIAAFGAPDSTRS